MNNKLSLQDLASILSEQTGKTEQDCERFLREFISVITEGVLVDKIVKVKGLGTFKIIQVEERASVSVNTGERVVIPAHNKFSFIPDKSLKELVNKPFSLFETVELDEEIEISDMEVPADEDVEDETSSADKEEVEVTQSDSAVVNEKVREEMTPLISAEESSEVSVSASAASESVEEASQEEKEIASEDPAESEENVEDVPVASESFEEVSQEEKEIASEEPVESEENVEDVPVASESVEEASQEEKEIASEEPVESEENVEDVPVAFESVEEVSQEEKEIVSEEPVESEENVEDVPAASESFEEVSQEEKEIASEEPAQSEEHVEVVSSVDNNQEEKREVSVTPVAEEVHTEIPKKHHSSRYRRSHHKSSFLRKHNIFGTDSNAFLFVCLLVIVVLGITYIVFLSDRYTLNKFLDSDSQEVPIVSTDVSSAPVTEVEEKDSVTLNVAEPEAAPVAEAKEENEEQPQKVAEEKNVTAGSKASSDVIAEVEIKSGDRLATLAKKFYGHKFFWVYIYQYNKDRIKNPNNVPIGTNIRIPAAHLYGIDAKDKNSIDKAASLQSQIMKKKY